MMPLRDCDLAALGLGAAVSLGLPMPHWGLAVTLLLPVAARWRTAPVFAGLVGLILGAINGVVWHESRLPEACMRQEHTVIGRISTLPRWQQLTADQWQVSAELDRVVVVDPGCHGPRRVWIRQYVANNERHKAMQYGTTVTGRVQLKPLPSQWNPGGVPDQARSASRSVDASGSLKGEWRTVDEPGLLQRFRVRRLAQWSERAGEGWVILRALVLGDTRGIDRDRWRDFRHLGVVHILVISGLHIGLLAALCQLILGLPRRFVTFPGDHGQSRCIAIAVLVITGVYAVLVGATLPVTRAYLMLAMTQVPTIFGWSTRSDRALLLALVAMVLWNPRVLLGASFWLSACATWLLVCGLRGNRKHFGLVALQLQMVVFLTPLTLFWFGEASWLGMATNLVLVPLVTMVMVPLGLIGLVLSEWTPSLAEWLWRLCGITWESLVPALSMVLQYCRSIGVIQSGLSWIGFFMGVLAIGLWAHYPRRAMALLLGAALTAVDVNEAGEAVTLTVLDVGQGLALIVQSGDRALLYDTGDGRPDQLTQADKVLLPYFRDHGINALDTVMISHGDRDHSGGLDVIRQQIPIGRHLGFAGEPCRNGERWRWESVEFLVLNGTGQDELSRNDQSCALLISTAEARVLVLGDMSSSKERELVLFWRDALAATHLVVAHHGSRSSTSYALLKWARPDWALISAGFANAFGHPHDEVLERLARAGQPVVLNTATAGAVALRLDRGAGVAPVRQRTRWSPYWLTVP